MDDDFLRGMDEIYRSEQIRAFQRQTQEAAQEALRDRVEQLTRQGQGVSIRPMRPTIMADTKTEYNKMLKASEVTELDNLLKNGASVELSMAMDTEGRIAVYGRDLGGTSLLFVVNTEDGTIYAETKRVQHLTKLLERMAQLEGYQLRYGERPTFETGVTVAYWPFNRGEEEIDDSELVTKTQPYIPEPEPEDSEEVERTARHSYEYAAVWTATSGSWYI